MQDSTTDELKKELKRLKKESKRDVNELAREEADAKNIFNDLMRTSIPFLDKRIYYLPQPPNPNVESAVNEFLPLLLAQPKPTVEHCLALLGKQTKIPKKDLHRRLRRLMGSSHADTKAEQSAHPTEVPRTEIYVGKHAPTKSITTQILDALKSTGNFYDYGGVVCLATIETGLETIVSPALLHHHIAQHADLWVGESEGGEKKYQMLPEAHLRAIVAAKDTARRFQAIKVHSTQPMLDNRFSILDRGFDNSSGTFISGDHVPILNSTELIKTILSPFCFEDETADLTNVVAMLLTGAAHNQFKGGVPCPIISGNKRGLGKTTLAQIMGIIMNGREVPSMTFLGNEEEMEKQMGAKVLSGIRMFLFDNVKVPRGQREISSSVVERTITDKVVSFRLLHHNKDIQLDNTFVVVFTVNHGDFSTDLLERSILINLNFNGEAAERSFKIADLTSYVLSNRKAILGELLGMWDRWNRAGQPLATVKHRFGPWAKVIGGVLEESGFHQFLANQTATVKSRSIELRQIETLANHCDFQKKQTAGELLATARSLGLFVALAKNSAPSDQNAAFGRVLSSNLGKVIKVKGMSAVLAKEGRNSSDIPTYFFDTKEVNGSVANESSNVHPLHIPSKTTDFGQQGEEGKYFLNNKYKKDEEEVEEKWWQK